MHNFLLDAFFAIHRLNETISVAQTYIKEAVDGNTLTLELKIYRVMDLNQVTNISICLFGTTPHKLSIYSFHLGSEVPHVA